jgi:hypothetical protein
MQVPAIKEVTEEELNQHFETLNLPRENATQADVVRAYKRLAQRLIESPADFEAFTVSFKVCEASVNADSAAEVGGKLNAITEDDESASPSKDSNGVSLEVDALEVYHQVVYSGRKHPELKVFPSVFMMVFQMRVYVYPGNLRIIMNSNHAELHERARESELHTARKSYAHAQLIST